jgi:phospholipid transport system substrate-binding protein
MFKSFKTIMLLLVLGIGDARAESDDPYVFVKSVASTTFASMKQDQAIIKSNPAHLRGIVEQQLMPHIDHVYASLSVLGTHAKDVPKEKLTEYFDEFRRFLITTYTASLSNYTNQAVEFEPSKPLEGRKTVSVKAVIKESGKPDINITFQVRRNKNNEWKAYDLTAEGISLVQSKRTEFAPMIRQKGIDSVIAFMREQNLKASKQTK